MLRGRVGPKTLIISDANKKGICRVTIPKIRTYYFIKMGRKPKILISK